FDELRRIIREEEPPRPSARLSTLQADALSTVAEHRRTEPKKLSQLVRGDLDWIVMKCLEKDRTRRYDSTGAFAAEVQRYLTDQPIEARPPSAAYRFRKFARRNKVALTMAGLVLLIFAALAGGIGWNVRDRAARLAIIEAEANRALKEAQRLQKESRWSEALTIAHQIQALLESGAGAEPLQQQVRELIKDLTMVVSLEEIRLWDPTKIAGGSGPSRAPIDAKYANAFREYGIDVESLEPVEAARQIRAKSIRLELAVALDIWARVRQRTYSEVWLGKRITRKEDTSWKHLVAVARAADPDEWKNQFRVAWSEDDKNALNSLAASAPLNDLQPRTIVLLALALREIGSSEQAIALLQKALRLHHGDYWIIQELAWTLYYVGRSEEAIRFYTASLSLRPDDPITRCSVAEALEQKGDLDEAIVNYRESIRLKPDYADAHGRFAWLLATCSDVKLRDPTEAIALAKKAVALASESQNWKALGAAYYRAGDWKAALEALRKSWELFTVEAKEFGYARPSEHFSVESCHTFLFLAMAHWQLGNKEEARKYYDRAVEWMAENSPNHPELRRFRDEARELLAIHDDAKSKKDRSPSRALKASNKRWAGECQPLSRTLTGPASPRRLVCAPGAMACSLYRRPPWKTGDWYHAAHLLVWIVEN
ncbi:MAG: tetratricopeptide repeat protein, partial [Planctomycetes bacterium]|nr:tetratricopeptide repeat protein [Planctomycetota bacterium]